jgi:NitT/TauT family transport system permease protein
VRNFLQNNHRFILEDGITDQPARFEVRSLNPTDSILSAIRMITGLALFILVWRVVALAVNKSLIPLPEETLRLLVEDLISPSILMAGGQTISKVILALLAAILIGIPIGLCLGLSDTLYEICRPMIMVIQAVPVISWLSLVIFTWGIGWKGPLFIAAVSLLPISILTTVSGVRNLDKQLLEMARLYRVSNFKIIKTIYLGTLMPFIAAILDISIGQAWKVILVTEYLCGGKGLGEQILMARMNIDFRGVWALTLLAVALGYAMERIIKLLVGKISRRWALV